MRHPYIKTQLVKQRDGFDCFVACFAMAEGVSYEEIADSRLGASFMETIKREGLYGKNLDEAFKRLGWVSDIHFKHTAGFTGGESFKLAPWIFARPAILQFTSLNVEGQSHVVYWDGYKVYDPSNGNKRTNEDIKLGCHHVWLLPSIQLSLTQ